MDKQVEVDDDGFTKEDKAEGLAFLRKVKDQYGSAWAITVAAVTNAVADAATNSYHDANPDYEGMPFDKEVEETGKLITIFIEQVQELARIGDAAVRAKHAREEAAK